MLYQVFSHLHSINRWIILVLLILTIVTAFQGWLGKKTYTDGDRKKALFTLIFTHVQLILGLVLFGLSPLIKDPGRLGRFYKMEHSSMMILAVILITVGYAVAKRKKVDVAKFKTTAILYLIALLVILAGIPWPFREALGGGWW